MESFFGWRAHFITGDRPLYDIRTESNHHLNVTSIHFGAYYWGSVLGGWYLYKDYVRTSRIHLCV